MKRLWRRLGIIAFWVSWPLLWLTFNNTERSRLLLIKNGRVLVTRGWLDDSRWSLPGGGLHKDETPRNSLIREVKEELGLNLSSKALKQLADIEVHDRGFTNTFHYFVAEIEEVKIKPRLLEVSEYAWLKPAELNKKNAAADALNGLPLLDLLK